jgi:hypothetical protein
VHANNDCDHDSDDVRNLHRDFNGDHDPNKHIKHYHHHHHRFDLDTGDKHDGVDWNIVDCDIVNASAIVRFCPLQHHDSADYR